MMTVQQYEKSLRELRAGSVHVRTGIYGRPVYNVLIRKQPLSTPTPSLPPPRGRVRGEIFMFHGARFRRA